MANFDDQKYRRVAEGDLFASDAVASDRAAFLRNTYLHLAGAVALWVGLMTWFVMTPAIAQGLFQLLAVGNGLLVFGGFMLVSWVASRMAHSQSSVAVQYAGLGLYAAAEAVIFTPLLYLAALTSGPEVIAQAAIITVVTFATLTAAVLISGANFSFLGPFLAVGSIAAFAVLILGFFMGWTLGLFFSGAMVLLMCGYILYETSSILHTFPTNAHVAAALALFSSLATLFWYVLRIMMALRGDD